MELRRRELERQAIRDKAEDERKDSAVVKGKLFGDAMRASAIRMGADPIEAIPFFRNVEQLFAVYAVPESLQPILIRSFLNEKAKVILGKLSPEVVKDYARLKAAILQELRLSANVYLERFNTCRRTTDETYVAFASKLKGLLDYYLENRHVDNFDKLCELLVCDRVKSSLSEGCLRYVLSIESATDTGWLPLQSLTAAIDRFVSAHSDERPKAFALGQTSHRPLSNNNSSAMSGNFPRPPSQKLLP